MYKSSRQKFEYNNISDNNDNVIITMLWHIENPGIVRTIYSVIFSHIYGNSPIFSHVQAQ